MVYIPRSKISKKTTSADGLFFEKATGIPYKGNFMETSDGKFFIGHNNNRVGSELVKNPLAKPKSKTQKKFSNSKGTRIYKILRQDIKKQLEKTTSVPITKPRPTLSDYMMGAFQRYFFKRINGGQYSEIDKKTFDSIVEQDSKYDSNLYEVGTLIWYIRGKDIHKQNALSIKQTETKYHNIKYLFPIFNEYMLPTEEIQENLNTKGGELYYEDGSGYKGPYHIHPAQGPMVGPTHSKESHDKLYFTNKLPKIPNQSYEEFNKNYDKITCYKCTKSGKNQKIIMKKGSRLVGCPEGTYTTHNKATENCIKKEETQSSPKKSGY